MGSSPNYWTTDMEIDFLDNIGTFREMPGNPLKLLKGYLRGIATRVNWGTMNKEKIVAHARARIRELERKRRR
jgi:hypothetical protein